MFRVILLCVVNVHGNKMPAYNATMYIIKGRTKKVNLSFILDPFFSGRLALHQLHLFFILI